MLLKYDTKDDGTNYEEHKIHHLQKYLHILILLECTLSYLGNSCLGNSCLGEWCWVDQLCRSLGLPGNELDYELGYQMSHILLLFWKLWSPQSNIEIHKMAGLCGKFEEDGHVNQYQVFRPVYTSNIYEKIMDYLYLQISSRWRLSDELRSVFPSKLMVQSVF